MTFHRLSVFGLVLFTGPRIAVSGQQVSTTQPRAHTRIPQNYGRLPLSFEENQGQTNAAVKFVSRGPGYTLFLTTDGAVLTLRHKERNIDSTFRMYIVGANPAVSVTGIDELPSKSNYFIGADPNKWRTNVKNYANVRYHDIYPGIDLLYYGNPQHLEYDFVVAPGVNANSIRLKFEGVNHLKPDQNGNVFAGDDSGQIELQKPRIYQQRAGLRKLVRGYYSMTTPDTISFHVADYDHSRPLIIDPVLVYSTYLGGSKVTAYTRDAGEAIAVDSAGYAYVTGETSALDFPTRNPARNAFQPNNGGSFDAFIAKFNASGMALIYSTYLGGRGDDSGYGIAVDGMGNAYVTGSTESTDFPLINAYQGGCNGSFSSPFVTKLNASGTALLYSTCLGVGGGGRGIAVDSGGRAYVTGSTGSANFPTFNAFQPFYGGGHYDAFVTVFNASGTALIYSSYLGGSGDDNGRGIALDSASNAYVTGITGSQNFPTSNAFQSNLAGPSNAFVTKISAGGALIYSSYLGGSGADGGDVGESIAVDTAGNAYVTGSTGSEDFPTVNAFEYDPNPGNGTFSSAFVTKIDSSGSQLVYSTYLGGSVHEEGHGIAVDSSGNAYVTGVTISTDFPTANAFQPHLAGQRNAFITVFDPTGTTLLYSSYLGGSGVDQGFAIAVDSQGNAYVTGVTGSSDFPTVNALQPKLNDNYSAFVSKISQVGSASRKF